MYFNRVSIDSPKRSKFDLSHEKKLSFNMAHLVPINCIEILPGDKFKVDTELMIRLAPMLAPIMHRVNVRVENFFVPTRLIWDESEDFFTGGPNGTSAPVAPTITTTLGMVNDSYYWIGSLADYLGLPLVNPGAVSTPQPMTFSALPFRAYQKIYNDYYRDQNLEADLDISTASGAVSDTEARKIMDLRRRCWEKDYFTSALPFAQRGAAVNIPITDAEAAVDYMAQSLVLTEDGLPANVNTGIGVGGAVAGDMVVNKTGFDGSGTSGRIENIAGIDITGIGATINDLRTAVQTQKWLEKMALGGARYIEQILVMFGVRSSDARLQRPEYLGGGKQPVVISEVLSTVSNATEDLPQGNMAGHGIAVGNRNGFTRSFEEHGYVISLLSVMPRTAYQQGLSRMWTRNTKFDYAWPDFAHLGEQAVSLGELYFDVGGDSVATDTFGYQSRYCEYKYMSDTVHGDFRTNLDYWHMGRKFDTPPALNKQFVEGNPTTRIFAVDDENTLHLYAQVYHRISAIRPLPYFGTPRL